MPKTLLHLCADIGSDSYPYMKDPKWKVTLVGKDIGVENFSYTNSVRGLIANPVCTDFSTAQSFAVRGDVEKGMVMVEHCLRIIEECKPAWWVLENPANGRLKEYLGNPKYTYQPWQYGSPWTKKTALWGKFNMPRPYYSKWDSVPKLEGMYIRPGRPKPSIAFMHKSHIQYIPEFTPFKKKVFCDADFRSLCSQGFAKAFYRVNQ